MLKVKVFEVCNFSYLWWSFLLLNTANLIFILINLVIRKFIIAFITFSISCTKADSKLQNYCYFFMYF